MKFYIENQNGEKIYEGTQEDCTKEIDRLIDSGDGYYFLFDETDPNEAWQEGGLVEIKEKMDDYDYWHQPYNYQRSFFTPEVSPKSVYLVKPLNKAHTRLVHSAAQMMGIVN